MLTFISLLVAAAGLLALTVYVFMQRPEFGKAPKGKRLAQMQSQGNYSGKQFENLSHTPSLAEDARMSRVLSDFLFARNPRSKPSEALPSRRTDLKSLPLSENILVWFGHSSYFIQIDGVRILVDPVFSGSASPLPPTTRSFKGSDVYSADDFPPIDLLLITHDHWDHLDYKTVKKLQPKVSKIVTSLGVGAHLEFWGYDPECIHELNWNEHLQLRTDFRLDCVPARHFSGRGFRRNGTLWSSFVLKTATRTLFLGGDSGYDHHFSTIGAQHGPFDLAILECGQYNPAWKYIHLLPEDEIQSALDLGAKAVLPVHWGKFKLALHDWDEPIREISKHAAKAGIPLWTPMIGETVYLDGGQQFSSWWEDLQ